MKSYIQGLITGIILVASVVLFMSATDNSSDVGRYQLASTCDQLWIFESVIDTKTGLIESRKRGKAKLFSKQ